MYSKEGTDFLKFIIRTNLMLLRSIDKDIERQHRKFVWNVLNEIENPIMKSVFANGRVWRSVKQEFLTVDDGEKNG